jgi:predicted RNA-binding Zn-ribbon protein involved in translation (DUF1610 family)
LKRLIPAKILAALDGIFQPTGAFFQFTPSIFVKAVKTGGANALRQVPLNVVDMFKCPDCGNDNLKDEKEYLTCKNCGAKWNVRNGIYDFREKE